MKISDKILKSLGQKAGEATTGSSRFRNMLDSHLSQVRAHRPEGASLFANLKSLSQAKSSEFAEIKDAAKDPDFDCDVLKDLDDSYYKKGLKKKTLAETFSTRFGSGLGERIDKFKPLIEAKAKKYGLDPNLLAGLIRQESNFNPYAVSSCGAMGLGQLMPETARGLGVVDPFNAAQNLDGAAKYLRQMLDTFGGNTKKALAAYNAGPGAVRKYGGIPPYRETQNYVKAIFSHKAVIEKQEFFASAATSKKDRA